MHCSVTAVTHLTSLGASKHKSPLFQPLEHCPVSWRLEKVQRWWQCDLGVTVCCVSMVFECSAFLQRSKVLFPAHGPVFSSPVGAPHNWGLCSLWSSVLCSIYARRVQCCCRVWDDMNSFGPPTPTPLKAWPYPLFELRLRFLWRSGWRVWLFLMWHLMCGVMWGETAWLLVS